MRRAWRMLATLCADAGYPTLRFDAPGCGDSLGELAGVGGLEVLVEATVAAAGELKRLAGVERVVLAGQGLGAAVAVLASARIGPEAAAILAPPSSGRAHLRELALWGRWVAESLGIAAGDPDEHSLAGFRLSPELRASIAALDLAATDAPAPRVFIGARPRSAPDLELAEHWRSQDAEVFSALYEEHADALEAPTNSCPPIALFRSFSAWLKRSAPIGRRRFAASPPAAVARLEGEGFSESLVRFGAEGRLAGVLCEPSGLRRGATVLFLNAGGDPHTGWGRTTVEHARALAARGVASFRIDMSDLGDAAGAPSGEPAPVLDPRHVEDAISAVDWLEANGLAPVMAAGRCSGADVAYGAAVRDPRLRELVLINQTHFNADLAALPDEPRGRLAYYMERSRSPSELMRRLLKGELDYGKAFHRLRKAAGGLGLSLLRLDRDSRATRRAARALEIRGAGVSFVYSAGDVSYDEFQAAFGPEGRRLRGRHEVILLEGADVAVTTPKARAALFELLARRALAVQTPAEGVASTHVRPHPSPKPSEVAIAPSRLT